ncbi:hypothetical protein [Pseudoalteromonas sp. McH1-42]|uniref:hypothetical protein n=1 Tax=Pseudoalteromonas sp. McH1-42 TaxID=2917752 RepID=UPI001EF471D5|nr:hypothetical protein [Pseudoalteromonas sp. McH1-42]MCG7564581.1 hypothetical protein [Pseudoalteromonas sp. McH1-42]
MNSNPKELGKFLRKRKRAIKNPQKYQSVFEENQTDIQRYIDKGRIEFDFIVQENERLPFLPWEEFTSELGIPIDYYEMSAQTALIEQNKLCTEMLAHSLGYAYLKCIISYFTQQRFVTRFDREHDGGVAPDSVFYLAMAVILQQPKHASHIFRLFEVGYARHWVNRSKSHIGDCMILLFDAANGSKSMTPIVDGFAYADIVADWNTQDFDRLTTHLTRLCDDQVTQVSAPPSKDFFEFNNMNWGFTPYAALMLLALRAQHGLSNPDFSHPGFGNVTQLQPDAPVTLVEDELLRQLLTRIRAQGFDEETALQA